MMKPTLTGLAIALLSLGLSPAAWADAPQTEPSQTDATALGTQEVGVATEAENSSERLDQLANQVNQDVSMERNQEEPQALPNLDEVLNLPPGMVVRGTRSGGLAIGTEF